MEAFRLVERRRLSVRERAGGAGSDMLGPFVLSRASTLQFCDPIFQPSGGTRVCEIDKFCKTVCGS